MGVTALAAPARLKIVQVRVRSGRGLCHLLSLGDRAGQGSRWHGDGAGDAAGERGITSGGCSGEQSGGLGTGSQLQPRTSPRGVTGQDLPFRVDKGDQPRTPNLTPSTRNPVPSLATEGWERGRGGPALPGGSQRWHWGHRVRRGSGQTRRAAPVTRSHAMGGGVGGEMAFKGPGRWPHVQQPGPGSKRRRSSSGSAPPAPAAGAGGGPQHPVHCRG